MRDAVARYAWDRSADTVHAQLLQALKRGRTAQAQPAPAMLPVAAAGGLRS